MLVENDEEASKEAEKAGIPLIYEMEDVPDGVYVDNFINRKLGRVGQPYKKDKKEEKEESEELVLEGIKFKKYGEELAMLCAVEARDQAIRLLNQQGAGYSPNHGK